MESLEHIGQLIALAREQSSLAADHVTILGACKGQTAETIDRAIRAGLTDFGENRVQETYDKWPPLKHQHPSTILHLIGPLQTNKVAEALGIFDVIQTLDRIKLADAIADALTKGAIATREFYVQVNTGEEPQKAGILPHDTNGFIAYCRALKLNVTGLMCIPPLGDMPAPHFALLRKLGLENGLSKLSMGMSGDFQAAVRMGSSCVRIGQALFGPRS